MENNYLGKEMSFATFAKIAKKIEKSKEYLIFSVGDSITEGFWSSSADNTYTSVFARGLAERFPKKNVIRYDGKRHKHPDSEIMPINSYGEPITVGEGSESKLTVVRSGIGGNSVRRMLNRRADFIGKEIDGKYADLFIFSVGINDSIKEVASKYATPEQYKKDLFELCSLVKERHPDADVILMTPTWFDLGESYGSTVDAYADAMNEFAHEYGIPVVDQHKSWMEHFIMGSANYGQRDWLCDKEKFGDRCHPSDAGHAAMAQKMLECIFGK